MESFLNFGVYPPEDLSFPNFDDLETINSSAYPSVHEEYHEEVIQDGKKHHLCTFPDCGKIFKFKSEISRHLVIHFNQRPFVCNVEGCNKSFKRADALENHVRIHTQDLPFPCDHPGCNLKFVTKSALRYHLLKHENQRVFNCEFPGCGKTFITKAQLKQHEKAENYHRKVAAINNVSVNDHPEPVKKAKTISEPFPMVSKDPFANLMATPAPRLAKTLAWETKNVDEIDETVSTPMNFDQTGGLENVLKKVLEENKMLKEKLDLCSRMMDVFQENEKLKKQLSTKADPAFEFNFGQRIPEPVGYPTEGSEFSFLNF